MVYEWKKGARISADAQAVGEELEQLEYKTAESVVKAAKESTGELRKCFEWNDSIAGEEYRKDQARLILRAIVTNIDVQRGGESETVQVRAYESVRFALPDDTPEKTMTYIPVREVLKDDQLRAQVMDRLGDTIAEAERTAENYEYLVPSFSKVKNKLKEAKEAIRA